MSFENIAGNIVSDFIFLLITIVLGWILLSITRRNKLLAFYGVRKSRRMIIYLSNLRITRGGAIGIDDQRRSYQGAATAFLEMLVANKFRALFNYLFPSLADRPGMLSHILISDVQVKLVHSPLKEDELEQSSSFITLGSPAYNVASRHAEKDLHSQAKFKLGRARVRSVVDLNSNPSGRIDSYITSASGGTVSTISLPSGTNVDDAPNDFLQVPNSGVSSKEANTAIQIKDVPDISDETYGFVERIIDKNANRFVFYAAGISELATAGAAHFLLTQWAYLQRKYPGNTPFLIVLRFEVNNYKQSSIVFER